MRKFIAAATVFAALAVPAVSMAAPGDTGVSTHNNPNAVIGYDVSAGNYNYLNGNDSQPTTGANRSALNAAQGPGAVSALIANARANTSTGEYGTFAPPGQ